MGDIHFPTLEIKSLRSREIQQFVKGLLIKRVILIQNPVCSVVNSRISVLTDGVQDMLPQSMACWYIKYFKQFF